VQDKNQQQDRFLETVLESLTHPFYVIDVNDYTVIMSNSAAGISRIASTATCYALTHKTDKPCDSEEHPCPLEIIKKTRKPVTVEHIHYDSDSNIRNVEVHGFPVFDSEGNVFQMIEYCLDVTDRKQTEEALHRSEERYSLAQRAANIGSWDWDIQTGELVWSEQIEPMFGFSKGKFVGTYQAFLDCVHPQDRQFVVDSVDACVEQGQDYSIEHRIVWPDGTVRWVSEKGDVTRDKSGKAIRMLGVVQDITEHKKAEEQINNLAKFPTENPYPVLRISEQGKIIYANNSSIDLLKYWDRKLGENIPEDWQTAIKDSLKTRRHLFKEVNLGDSVVSFAIAPVPAGRYANIYGRDITEYRRVEQELKKINEQLELRVKERTEQLQETVEDLRKEVKERLQAESKLIDNQNKLRDLSTELIAVEERERRNTAAQLHDSIGQLLALSKKELGALVKNAPESIRNKLEHIWELVRQSVEQTRNLTFELSSTTLYTVGLEAAIEELAEKFSEAEGFNCCFSGCKQCKDLDEKMQILLYRAVRELLINVAKHSDAQNAEISTERINNDIRILVSDDGIGFDVSELDGRKGQLSGFGLFSLQERLANIGGKLKIESKIGQGTKVAITVPLKQKIN
jgi:PAS domain S-box-containing protein